MADNFDDIFSALGKEQAKRGRKKGAVSPHTVKMNEKLDKLKPKKVGTAQVIVIPADLLTTAGDDPKPVSYDQRRNYAKAYCERNAGWVIAPKSTDEQVILVKR